VYAIFEKILPGAKFNEPNPLKNFIKQTKARVAFFLKDRIIKNPKKEKNWKNNVSLFYRYGLGIFGHSFSKQQLHRCDDQYAANYSDNRADTQFQVQKENNSGNLYNKEKVLKVIKYYILQ